MSARPLRAAQVDRVVEIAVRFIEERRRAHRFEFAMEVGGHLFVSLFRGSKELLRSAWSGKDQALDRIARDPRVGLSVDVLDRCVHTYLLVKEFGRSAPDLPRPDITPSDWESLWPLEGDPDDLVKVAIWAGAEDVGRRLVADVALLVEPYVLAGGRLEDLLVGAPGEGRPDSPYRRIARFLDLAASWIEEDGPRYSPAERAALLAMVDRLLAMSARVA